MTRLPKQFGKYRAIRVVGSGGMGVVYLAEDPIRAVRVAVKLVRPELASDPSYQERFRREIAVAFRVTGQHTARVLAADLDADSRILSPSTWTDRRSPNTYEKTDG